MTFIFSERPKIKCPFLLVYHHWLSLYFCWYFLACPFGMQMVSIIKERDSILKSAFLKNEGQVLSTRTSLTVREESLRAKLFSPDFSSSQRNARKATLWQQEKKRRKLQSLWWLGTSERTKASSTKAPQNFVKWHGIGKSSLMIGHSFLSPLLSH